MALLAVALLGALTHQAMSVLVPVRAGRGAGHFVTRFRAVQGAGYATAVCVLWIVTFIFGAWIYTKYRMYVRIPIEQQGFWKTQGVFELKEHLATIGLGLLPIYWFFWKNARNPEYDSARRWLTVTLAGMCLVHVPGRPHRQQRAGIRIMSTTTDTRAGASAPSLASSAAFRTFAVVFAIAAPVIYVVCEMRNWPLFTYHPATDRFDLVLCRVGARTKARRCTGTAGPRTR